MSYLQLHNSLLGSVVSEIGPQSVKVSFRENLIGKWIESLETEQKLKTYVSNLLCFYVDNDLKLLKRHVIILRTISLELFIVPHIKTKSYISNLVCSMPLLLKNFYKQNLFLCLNYLLLFYISRDNFLCWDLSETDFIKTT